MELVAFDNDRNETTSNCRHQARDTRTVRVVPEAISISLKHVLSISASDKLSKRSTIACIPDRALERESTGC